MTSYQERMGMVPRKIVERAMYDVAIHQAIRVWLDSNESVEWLLINLVLLLSDLNNQQHQAMKHMLETSTVISQVIGNDRLSSV